MKKGDDFFRVTFNRSSEEIKRFEDNMHKFTDKCRVSRPLMIAAICNYFFDNNMELILAEGRYEVRTIRYWQMH